MPHSKQIRQEENESYLLIYRALLSVKMQEDYQWKELKNWTHNHFEKLSILLKTTLQEEVSELTLKRALGKQESATFPSDATLNTLAKFLKDTSWEEFKSWVDEQPNMTQEKEKPLLQATHLPPTSWLRQHQKKIILGLVFFVVLGIALASLPLLWRAPTGKIVLKYEKNPQQTMPHTTVIGYQLENVDLNKDTCYISYYTFKRWDRVLAHHEGNESFYVTNPEVYKYYLRIGGRIVDSLTVSFRTEGWYLLFRKTDDISHTPDTEEIDSLFLKNGTLHYPHPLPKHYFAWTSFFNTGHITDVSIDEMTIEAEIKNEMLNGGIPAYDSKILLEGEYGDKLQVNFTETGADEFSYINFGYTLMRGYEVGRGSLATDLAKWRKVKLVTKNRFLTVYLDGTKVAETSYHIDFGKLWGIAFCFRGSGMVRNIKVNRADKSIAYQFLTQ